MRPKTKPSTQLNPFSRPARKLARISHYIHKAKHESYVRTASRHADEEANEAFDTGYTAGHQAAMLAVASAEEPQFNPPHLTDANREAIAEFTLALRSAREAK